MITTVLAILGRELIGLLCTGKSERSRDEGHGDGNLSILTTRLDVRLRKTRAKKKKKKMMVKEWKSYTSVTK